MSADHLPTESQLCSKDDPDADHSWESVEYDPSVGSLSSGRVCVVCERFEFVDYEGDDDY